MTLAAELEVLEGTHSHVKAGREANPLIKRGNIMYVTVVVIENSHGTEVEAFFKEADAHACVEAWVRRWWATEMNDPMPDDIEEAIDKYFEESGEGYSIHTTLVNT